MQLTHVVPDLGYVTRKMSRSAQGRNFFAGRSERLRQATFFKLRTTLSLPSPPICGGATARIRLCKALVKSIWCVVLREVFQSSAGYFLTVGLAVWPLEAEVLLLGKGKHADGGDGWGRAAVASFRRRALRASTKPGPTAGKKAWTWFAPGEDRPLFAFAGIWTLWRGVRGTAANPIEGEHQLFGFLTTDANAIVAPVHRKAMPVLLTMPEEWTCGCPRRGRKPQHYSGLWPPTRYRL